MVFKKNIKKKNKNIWERIKDWWREYSYSIFMLFIILPVTLIFVICVTAAISPIPIFLLTPTQHGEFGNAMGGITAPIIGVVSAFVIFITFRAQNRFNEMQKKNSYRDSLSDLFIDIKDSIDSLIFRCEEYEYHKTVEHKTVEHKTGIDAIEYFFKKLNLRHIEKLNRDSCVKKIRFELEKFSDYMKHLEENEEYKDQIEIKRLVTNYYDIILKDVITNDVFMENFDYILRVDKDKSSHLNTLKEVINKLIKSREQIKLPPN